jgi:PadR family transcriptional regulator PadR
VPERITKQLVAVLAVLCSDPGREWYGLELMEHGGLSSGTLYPILHRLVLDGWLVRTRDIPSDVGGTSRRLYRLTALGERTAEAMLAARRARQLEPVRGLRPSMQPR